LVNFYSHLRHLICMKKVGETQTATRTGGLGVEQWQ
jgi:hypothetical protein